MQTYDWASVMSGRISVVQPRVREGYVSAYFFHCAAHLLNLVLSVCLLSSSLESSLQMWLLSAYLVATVLEGRICCIQLELIYLALEKLCSTIVDVPSVFFMISTKPF